VREKALVALLERHPGERLAEDLREDRPELVARVRVVVAARSDASLGKLPRISVRAAHRAPARNT